jgi:cell division protein FtsB
VTLSKGTDRRAFRRRLAAAGLGFVLAIALLGLGGNGLIKVWRMKQEAEFLDREIQRLEAENDRLARTIDRLREDPSLIEKIAREELGFVKDREKVLKFPSPPGPKADGPPGAR